MSTNWLDPCLFVPFPSANGKESWESFYPYEVDVVDENSHLCSQSVKDNEDLNENSRLYSHSGKDDEDLKDKAVEVKESSDFVLGNTEMVVNIKIDGEDCEHSQEVMLHQEEQLMEIEPDKGSRDGIILPDCTQGSHDPLNWLLGARGRFLLTSERPNKKRKLLGAAAGLEQLVLLPSLDGEAGPSCDLCCLGETDMISNRILHCNLCEVSVHQKCYGVHVAPNDFWLCAWCSVRSTRRSTRSDAGRPLSMPCVLCPKEKGALKPVKGDLGQTADGGNVKFVHLFCSLWTPDVLVENMESMEPVSYTGDMQENRAKMVCSLCKVAHGACVRCSHGTCRICFHPMCARESRLQMEIWGKSGHNNVEMRVFCSKHSTGRCISSINSDKSAIENGSAEFKPDDANLVTGKKEEPRVTRNNKDKFMNNAATSSSSSTLNKAQTEPLTSPSTVTVRSVESQETESTDMVVDRPVGVGNVMKTFGDVPTILGKLIDQGKGSADDIESELGHSESLEAALVPETTTFCPGLKLKITKLLRNSVLVPSAHQGTSLTNESKDFTDARSELEEGVSSFGHCFAEGDNTNKDWADSIENGFHSCHDCDDDNISGQRFVNFDGNHCYIHPLIGKKLRNLWGHILKQNGQATYCHEEISCLQGQNLGGSLARRDQLGNIAAAGQVSKARLSGILDYSPNDEIEGEIVYLQSRLLNEVVALQQTYEDLILKVVQGLSHEFDSFNKRKWDHIIVNQYLRDIREAKKRGNSERRHKEAMAILAASAPFVASTLPNAIVRKKTENDLISAKPESILKANAGSSRVSQPASSSQTKANTGSSRVSQPASLPQTKDSSFSNSKISADTSFGIFDLGKFSKKNAPPCDICMRHETVLSRISSCSNCKAAVHLGCYQHLTNPTGPWKCELCREIPSEVMVSGSQSDCNGAKPCLAQCGFCHGTSGAFRKTTKGKWVHAFCAEWLLEGTFTRGQSKAVDGVEGLLNDKGTCSICHQSVGTCLKCSTVDCDLAFHPACARDAGLYMSTQSSGSMLRHKAYCSKHSIEERKADRQTYKPEEVKSMKRMRVELERLRLLCERIVKREKAKMDLLVCENDVIAARRDSVAFSTRTNCYASGPGASSESATTSINNNLYSGMMQKSDDVTVRSDDVTVDSLISRKHTARFPLQNRDTDRNTADSSTSTVSYKQKLDDGESPADKKPPERPAASAFEKSEDGEMKSTDEKKRCPPKRVYTRRSSISKKKLWSRGVVEGPGG